jgi:hypothetical protein
MADRNIRLAGMGRPAFGRPLMGITRPGFRGPGIQRPAWQRPQAAALTTPPWLARAQLVRHARLQATLAGLDAVRSIVAKEVGDDPGGTATPYDTSSASADTSTATPGLALAVSPSPPEGATGVPVSTAVSAMFSGPVDPTTILQTTFTVMPDGGSPLTGTTLTYDATSYTATLSLAAGTTLTPATTYTARLDPTIRDAIGNPLGAPITWSFTTAAAPATPSITNQNPAPGAAAAPSHGAVTVTFSDDMDRNSITDGTFTVVDPSGTLVSGRVDYDPATRTAILSPQAALADGTTYTARLDSAIRTTAGASLAPTTWTFTTAGGAVPPPTGLPTVTGTTPTNGATGVATSTTVTATFSADMDDKSITQGTFTLTPSVGAPGSITYDAQTRIVTLTPPPLAPGTTYTARLDSAIRDKAGNTLVSDVVWAFTTAGSPPATPASGSNAPATTPPQPATTTTPAATPPSVTGTKPTSGATGAEIATPITATFSTPMDPTTISSSSFTLASSGGAAVTADATYDATTNTASLTPKAPATLSPAAGYTARLDPSIRSAEGAQLAAPYTWSFTTAAAPASPGGATGSVPQPEMPNHEVVFELFDEFHPDEFTTEGFPFVDRLNKLLMDRGEPRVDPNTRDLLYNAYVQRRIHEGERFASPDESIRFTPPDKVIVDAFKQIKKSELTTKGYPRDDALTKALGKLGYEGVETERFHPLWDQYPDKPQGG